MSAIKNTLYIRRLPAELTPEEKEDFLTHFGAVSVRCLPDSGCMKYSAFAVFSSDEAAEQALVRLHQLEVFGSRLQVQFANEQEKQHFPHVASFKRPVIDDGEALKNDKIKSKGNDFNTKVEAMQRGINNISTLFGLNYPINPKLRYNYPRPSNTILTNIAHALAAVPKFYVQVLHLMNKLNLPPPFGPLTQTPPMFDDSNIKRSRKRRRKERSIGNMDEEEMETTSESELESDDDLNKGPNELEGQTQANKRQIKRPKLHQLIATSVTNFSQTAPSLPIPTEEVFEMPESQSLRKIEFKLNLEIHIPNVEKGNNETETQVTNKTEDVKSDEGLLVEGGFGQFTPVITENMNVKDNYEDVQDVKHISRKDVEENRMSLQELQSLPVFKNYDPGEMTSRLYIKNLSKEVTEKDLNDIYLYYVNEENEDEMNRFHVQLMKTGKMKGQAFITLPDEERAKKALEDTNGFVLHGKPFVVQFARSKKPKESESSNK